MNIITFPSNYWFWLRPWSWAMISWKKTNDFLSKTCVFLQNHRFPQQNLCFPLENYRYPLQNLSFLKKTIDFLSITFVSLRKPKISQAKLKSSLRKQWISLAKPMLSLRKRQISKLYFGKRQTPWLPTIPRKFIQIHSISFKCIHIHSNPFILWMASLIHKSFR